MVTLSADKSRIWCLIVKNILGEASAGALEHDCINASVYSMQYASKKNIHLASMAD